MHRYLTALLLLVAFNVGAEPPPPMEPLPGPPPPPPAVVGDAEEELEPEVSIVKRGDDMVYEYRINGQLYMVRIVPRIGPAYYFIDTDGDGSLESRYNKLEPDLLVPRWMIYRW